MKSTHIQRRDLLLAGGAFALSGLAAAQAVKPTPALRPFVVAQVIDTSAAQQDVSKDFVIGSRAAWQDINAKGGVRGRLVQHQSIEVDGTAASMRAAVASIRDNTACVALSGTAGDVAAGQLAIALRQEKLAIAHAAPWLQNSSGEIDEGTFPIFAARQEQVAHALRSLAVMSVRDVGVVYASPVEYAAYQEDFSRTAVDLKLRLQTYRANGDLAQLGRKLTQTTPAILLFVGGTPELVQFTQGLETQARQRYVVALADVNLQTLVQMGAARNTPVIATQAVPMVNATLPIVRQYRQVLSRLFDEPPAPLSLAGFIAARYTYEVLSQIEAPPTRQNVVAAFQRRADIDLGGYHISFDPRRRGGNFVTQSMLTMDGRVVG